MSATVLRSLYWLLGVASDALRGELGETLRRRELLFEFQVQLWVDAHRMPIEDTTVRWPESQSPCQTVAHLLLPRQESSLRRDFEAFRRLAFNVGHSLAEHRTWGGSIVFAAGPTSSRPIGGGSTGPWT